MLIAKLKREGLERVLDGRVGMTFPVDSFTPGVRGPVAHVRDYRYFGSHYPYQTWSIGADGYELLAEEETAYR